MEIKRPTKYREMSASEYSIVTGVFGNTLPSRMRIIITDGAGMDGRAFTIPTSLVTSILGTTLARIISDACVMGDYLMNVGRDYNNLNTSQQELLVHETTHVWQGHNSTFSVGYVFSSVYNQVRFGGAAYKYTAGRPWRDYNAEQQASIVSDWFALGKPNSGPLYPYIVNHVRKGDA
jgi:hypothetical protein